MAQISVNVFIDRENKTQTICLRNDAKVRELLEKLNINPVAVIVSRNNELVLEDDLLKDMDGIKILSVISGG